LSEPRPSLKSSAAPMDASGSSETNENVRLLKSTVRRVVAIAVAYAVGEGGPSSRRALDLAAVSAEVTSGESSSTVASSRAERCAKET
jgi:hypothetical protein